jgi:hypothetical protein
MFTKKRKLAMSDISGLWSVVRGNILFVTINLYHKKTSPTFTLFICKKHVLGFEKGETFGYEQS